MKAVLVRFIVGLLTMNHWSLQSNTSLNIKLRDIKYAVWSQCIVCRSLIWLSCFERQETWKKMLFYSVKLHFVIVNWALIVNLHVTTLTYSNMSRCLKVGAIEYLRFLYSTVTTRLWTYQVYWSFPAFLEAWWFYFDGKALPLPKHPLKDPKVVKTKIIIIIILCRPEFFACIW